MYPAGSQHFREIIESPEEAGPSLRPWRRILIPFLASLIFDSYSLSSSSTSRTVPHWYVHLGNTCIKSSVRDLTSSAKSVFLRQALPLRPCRRPVDVPSKGLRRAHLKSVLSFEF